MDSQQPDLQKLLPLLALAAGGLFLLYAYFSACLMVIARKTATANGWMAWIPLLNMVLLIQIARRSLAYILLLFIPLVNLVIVVDLWMGAARQRGKPAALGLLILLPPFSLLLPLILALGPASEVGPRLCRQCHTPAQPQDRFCGRCGGTLTAAPPPPSGGGGCVVAVLAVMALVVATPLIGWFALSKLLAYNTPARQPPQLPPAVAGTMRVFPTDTPTSNPARPGEVLAQRFPAPPATELNQRLPPGVEAGSLPQIAQGYTSSRYRSAPGEAPVDVTVLQTSDSSVGPRLGESVTRSAGGQASGVQVTSPQGEQFTGTRVGAGTSTIYVLTNQDGTLCILIYTTDSAQAGLAERLATNVANGPGLLADPGVSGTVGVLTATPPDNFTMTQLSVTPGSELGGGSSAGDASSQDIPLVPPDQLVSATYVDASGAEYVTLVAQYPDPRGAWMLWWLVKALLLADGAKDQEVFGGQGLLYTGEAQHTYLFFLRGPYVVGIQGPGSAGADALRRLGESLQI